MNSVDMNEMVPISESDAADVLGHEIHKGFRVATDRPEAGEIWQKIHDLGDGWDDVLRYALAGLRLSGVVLVQREADMSGDRYESLE